MTFLMGTSILMAGLLSVSIPILIHLLHRQKTTPLLWGAMIFLKQSPLQMKRRKQVDHWLLMLLRMAVLAFLAWLLAQPKLNLSKYNLASGNQAVDVAVVIDHSLSMGRTADTRTLFAKAQNVIDDLTTGANHPLHGRDTLSVILAEHQPRKLTPRPVFIHDISEIGQLTADVHALKPGNTDCNIPEAIAAAREVLSHGPNMRKIVLIVSDEQRSNWALDNSPDSSAAWHLAIGEESSRSHRVEVHSYPLVPDTTASNITVGSISMQPSVAGIDRTARFTATITNSGPKPVPSVNVQFIVTDNTGAAKVVNAIAIPELAAKQSSTVTFDHTFKTAGSSWVKICTPDVTDALAADNESVFAVNVWQTLPVLVIRTPPATPADTESEKSLTAAMQSDRRDNPEKSLIQPNFVAPSDCGSIRLEDYYAVVLNNIAEVPAPLQDKLGDYVNSGHGLWVIMGDHSSGLVSSLGKAHQNIVLFAADLRDEKPHAEQTRTDSATTAPSAAGNKSIVEVKDPTNPIVTIFSTTVDRMPLSGAVETSKWWSVAPRDSNTKTVLAATKGDPLVLERQLGAGQVVVWTTSVDGTWNNWQGSPDFSIMIHETIYRLTDAQTRGNRENITAGQSFAWSGPAIENVPTIEVTVVPPGAAITAKALSGGVATLTASSSFANGETVVVAGVGAPFDGSWQVTGSTPNAFSYSISAGGTDIVSAPCSGTAGVAEARQAQARDGRYEFDYQNAFLPGIYTLKLPETYLNSIPKDYLDKHPRATLAPVYYGVGINPREFENTPLSTDDVAALQASNFLDKTDPRIEPAKLATVITRVNDETADLWKYLALFVVVSLCLETFMTFRMAGLQKNIDASSAGLVRA